MKRKLTLNNPIKINGKPVKEFDYDAEKITTDQFLQACMKSADLSKSQSFNFKLKENDYALHTYLGFMAVVAENPGVALEDLERITGTDLLKFTDIGMLFIYRKSEAQSDTKDSEKSSEITAATSIQALPTSEK